MKIGIDVRCLASGKRTGVEEYTISLLEELFSMDHENTYILFFNAYHGKMIDLSWAKKFPQVSVCHRKIPNKLLNLSLWYLRWPKIDLLLGGVDLLFLPNVNFCAVSDNAKVVMTLHDLSFERYKQTFSWKHRFWHYFINPKRLCQRADHIIAVSDATRKDLSETYGITRPTDVTMIHNGLPDTTHDALPVKEAQLIKERLHLPRKYILYFGTIEPRKNIATIIHAYEQLRRNGSTENNNLKLVIAGNEGWRGNEVMQQITGSLFADDIIVTGAVTADEKEYILTGATIFLYPSYYEGFGFPPLEAAAAHVPVITSHTSSLPEIVGAHAIMIDPLRGDEVATALQTLLSDDVLFKYIATSAKINTHNFSWVKTAQETKDILTKIAAQKPA